MTRQTIVYISGSHEFIDLKGFRKSILDFAQANGLGELKSDCYSEEVVPGEVLASCIKSATDGASFITNAITSFGVLPSEQKARITALLGKGVRVFVLGLGPLDACLHILRATWDAGAELERQLAETQANFETFEKQLAADKQRFEDRLVARMSEVMGHGSVRAFYGANGGHAPEPIPEVTDETALRVRELREARKWSQDELAQRAGCSRSMVARAETVGRCSDLGKIMSVLEHMS